MANPLLDPVIVQADALTDEEIALLLVEEFKSAPPVNFHLTAEDAYMLVGILQLATRYPGFADTHPDSMKMVRDLADQLKPIGPVTAMTLEWGFQRGFDRKPKPNPSTGSQ